MKIVYFARLTACATAIAISTAAFAADSDDASDAKSEIIVTAHKQSESIENAPSTKMTVTANDIAEKINAVSAEDTIKYLPSLVVRKRHIGDNFAPIATRTSGLGASARSLIYADGVLLSALIANNNGNGSPRWAMVSPSEIEKIDVLYGPYSAAYSGNSIGSVVNITTKMPDHLQASFSAITNIQQSSIYASKETLPTTQLSGNIGGRLGPLSLSASATRTVSNGQPLSFVTATRPAAQSTTGAPTTGAFDDLNKTGAAIIVLGAGGIEHHLQDNLKLKATLDISDTIRLTYVIGLFQDASQSTAQSYLSNAITGAPVWSGAVNIKGYSYSIAANAFASSVYKRDAQHLSHSISLSGEGDRLDWQLIGTSYDYAHDIQRTPTGAMPTGFTGGAGQSVRLDGTGWRTLDGKLSWHIGNVDSNIISLGGHYDRYTINSNRYVMTDWTGSSEGALNQASFGRTETKALWAQDAIQIKHDILLTLGGRFESWRAYEGSNFSSLPTLNVNQPERKADGFSPKATLEWNITNAWAAKFSFGKAYRFPTVGELYQAITTGTTLTVPNPDLKPEQALSQELSIVRKDEKGSVRLSFFNESIKDALISQSAPLVAGSTTLYNYVQNVDLTRVRGIEAVLDRHDILPHIDISTSVTYADSQTRKDTAFPAAIGKLLPSVPRWKANAVITWRPDPMMAFTAAARYASRNYANLDNSDIIGNTYQGFDKYFVVDLRANFKVNDKFDFAVGVDNVNNDKYFLFHPFPQRSITAQVNVKI